MKINIFLFFFHFSKSHLRKSLLGEDSLRGHLLGQPGIDMVPVGAPGSLAPLVTLAPPGPSLLLLLVHPGRWLVHVHEHVDRHGQTRQARLRQVIRNEVHRVVHPVVSSSIVFKMRPCKHNNSFKRVSIK